MTIPGVDATVALSIVAAVGDFHRFPHPRELAAWLGITPSEYSSGPQQHRGHITLAGNRHARRLLLSRIPPAPRLPNPMISSFPDSRGCSPHPDPRPPNQECPSRKREQHAPCDPERQAKRAAAVVAGGRRPTCRSQRRDGDRVAFSQGTVPDRLSMSQNRTVYALAASAALGACESGDCLCLCSSAPWSRSTYVDPVPHARRDRTFVGARYLVLRAHALGDGRCLGRRRKVGGRGRRARPDGR
ncbi:MAG: transposase [Solirubrobacteraceae bacterium]